MADKPRAGRASPFLAFLLGGVAVAVAAIAIAFYGDFAPTRRGLAMDVTAPAMPALPRPPSMPNPQPTPAPLPLPMPR